MGAYVRAPHGRVARPANAKQINFIRDLLGEVGDNVEEQMLAHREAGTFDDSAVASRVIDALKARAKAARFAKGAGAGVPEPGYYAVEYGDVLRFYRVVEGKGRWEGRRFLNRFRSDLQDRVFFAEQKAVFAAILAEPEGARKRFAEELTRCWMCGRMLTDAESRRLGVGPECRKML